MTLSEAHAILLVAAMESDLLVRAEEVEAGRRILHRASEKNGVADLGAAIGEHGNLEEAATLLKAQPTSLRENIIADLWEISFSDGEVHQDEKDFITRIARMLDVPVQSPGSWPIPTSGN